MTVVRNGPGTLEIVPVFVNGRGPYRFLLDTGSSTSSVSGKLASTLHLPRTGGTAQIRGVVKGQKVPIVAIRGWKVGDVALTPDNVAVLSPPSGTGSVAGLLGSDELRHFSAVTVDFRHHQLRLALP